MLIDIELEEADAVAAAVAADAPMFMLIVLELPISILNIGFESSRVCGIDEIVKLTGGVQTKTTALSLSVIRLPSAYLI
jgi:hypothetical protein